MSVKAERLTDLIVEILRGVKRKKGRVQKEFFVELRWHVSIIINVMVPQAGQMACESVEVISVIILAREK